MATMKIRHNDSSESIKERMREKYGDAVEICEREGEFGEKVLVVSGRNVDPDDIHDLQREETWVQSAECIG